MKDELDRLDEALDAYLSARKDRKRCNGRCGIDHPEAIEGALTELIAALREALSR